MSEQNKEPRPYMSVKLETPDARVYDDPLAEFARLQLSTLLEAVVMYSGDRESDITHFRLVGDDRIYAVTRPNPPQSGSSEVE